MRNRRPVDRRFRLGEQNDGLFSLYHIDAPCVLVRFKYNRVRRLTYDE